MTSKQEQKAFFDWQKSSDEYLFSATLLIGFFAVRNEFPGSYKLWIYIILGLLIFLVGWGLIRTKTLENVYLKFLQDRRYSRSNWDIVREWAIFIITLVLGIAIVVVAMNIWQALTLAAFGK